MTCRRPTAARNDRSWSADVTLVMSETRRRFVLTAVVTATLAVGLGAQTAALLPESADVSAGWSALAGGDVATAATIADGALTRFPNSLAAGALLVASEVQRGGGSAGLAAYSKWLGSRAQDDPYLLRMVAL